MCLYRFRGGFENHQLLPLILCEVLLRQQKSQAEKLRTFTPYCDDEFFSFPRSSLSPAVYYERNYYKQLAAAGSSFRQKLQDNRNWLSRGSSFRQKLQDNRNWL